MRFRLGAFALLAIPFAVACAPSPVDEVADASGGLTEGIVLMERSTARDGATQSSVSAKFVHLSALTDADLAEQVVGAKLDLPALGSCKVQVSDAKVDASTLRSLGPIELIDVGDVSLRMPSSTISLAVRAFPDVGELVSGVFYTSRDTSTEMPALGGFKLEGTGAGSVDRFTVEADAPPAPENVLIAGSPLTEDLSLSSDRSAKIEWQKADSRPYPQGDAVLVDLSVESGSAIRCAFSDTGSSTIPDWVLKAKALGPLPREATITVHRIRRRTFTGLGLDSGEVHFDLSVMGRVTIAPRSEP